MASGLGRRYEQKENNNRNFGELELENWTLGMGMKSERRSWSWKRSVELKSNPFAQPHEPTHWFLFFRRKRLDLVGLEKKVWNKNQKKNYDDKKYHN